MQKSDKEMENAAGKNGGKLGKNEGPHPTITVISQIESCASFITCLIIAFFALLALPAHIREPRRRPENNKVDVDRWSWICMVQEYMHRHSSSSFVLPVDVVLFGRECVFATLCGITLSYLCLVFWECEKEPKGNKEGE